MSDKCPRCGLSILDMHTMRNAGRLLTTMLTLAREDLAKERRENAALVARIVTLESRL